MPGGLPARSIMPTYSEMVTEAILALKERNGSSVQAIKKHIITSHPDLAFAPHQLRSALKKGTEAGKYIKVKSSFKLSPEAKKPPLKKPVKPVKKAEPKKVIKVVKKVVKKASTTQKKAAPKKASVKTSKKPVPSKKTVTKPAASKKAPAKKATAKKTSSKKGASKDTKG